MCIQQKCHYLRCTFLWATTSRSSGSWRRNLWIKATFLKWHIIELGIVVHTYNLRTQKAEAEGIQVQSGLHSNTQKEFTEATWHSLSKHSWDWCDENSKLSFCFENTFDVMLDIIYQIPCCFEIRPSLFRCQSYRWLTGYPLGSLQLHWEGFPSICNPETASFLE